MKLTKELIREKFGPDVKISSRFPLDGFAIKTGTGGRVIVTSKKFEDIKGGADIWDGVVGLAGALWGSLQISGSIENVAHAMQSGLKLGVPIEAGETKHFFGLLKTPPPVIPVPSGVHGSQGLDWTASHCRAAGLLGRGKGIRVGACWETGDPLHYAGEDAENSNIGFGAPGEGKGTCFQIPILMDFAGSSSTIDPSGQLFGVCAADLLRQGKRVIPIMPFTEGFSSHITTLAGQTRCLNPMDVLNPHTEAFPSACAELSQLLHAEEKGQHQDRFFRVSGGNLITILIASVKLYAHPSEQNLCEV